jgi:type VI secretion system secreted protein VgrG
MDQVNEFWNILAVTGFTTVGTVETSDRGTKLQLSTNTIGSGGSIQVVGGSGNEYVVPVLTSGELIDNTHMVVSANSIAAQAVASHQWFRLQAENYQNKGTGISNNTSVTVLSNTPIAGQSTVTLLNQELGELYFGSPRSGINIEGNTFRIEKQGSLTCLSWNGIGTSPNFSSTVNFNDTGNWVVDVSSTGTYSVGSTPSPGVLGTAGTYGILAASAITNSVGTSIINGNLGEYPGSTVTGTFTVTGATNLANGAALTAQGDALTAYNSFVAEAPGTVIPSALDGQTLTPGVYSFSSGAATLATSGPGTLTFNGAGTYVIIMASTLTTGAGGVATMALTNGATAANIYWIVGSSATINSGSAGTFQGNIIAQASITDTLGGTVNGSLIALTGAVTLSAAANVIAPSSGPEAPVLASATASVNGSVVTVALTPIYSQVAFPGFSPVAGSYGATQTVTIFCGTPGATIYYTTNGSTPTIHSTLYSAPITVSASETVNAIAVLAGLATSQVATAQYIIT